MNLRILFENGETKIFPLGKGYCYVEITDIGVLKKLEAYDVLKWVKTYKQFVTTKHFIMTDFIFPLIKDGKFYSSKYDVIKYSIEDNGTIVNEYLPMEELNEDNKIEFWEHLLNIPI